MRYSLRTALLTENYEVVGTDTVPASSCFPIQRDLNARHVFMGLSKYRPGSTFMRPILVCRGRDNTIHIVDGHHGWATACLSDDVIRVNFVQGDPENIFKELLKGGCDKSAEIPPQLDLMNAENDLYELIDMYGPHLGITPADIDSLPRPLVNGGEGIFKRDMPQCDHLRRK